MSTQLRDAIYSELDAVSLIDPHTHIDALRPASETLGDILGYHYYTELAHSGGMPRDRIEEPGLDPKEKVGRLIENLGPVSNTVQYSWLVEMAQELLGFEGDLITADNWEPLYDRAVEKMAADDWADQVLRASKLDGVFLTNDFDDPLEGFDTGVYIPCLRTDDLVFHLGKREVRERLEQATGHVAGNVDSLRAAIGALFDHFVRKGARACAISLPPDFAPAPVSDARAATALQAIADRGDQASDAHHRAAAHFVFWNLAQRCSDYRLPFDLMIGVNRGVYPEGVYQGQDLYDSRVSLIQYKQLFNSFPDVTFPISVLASVTNQELTSYAWIFPNVVTNGHWWYSNTPTYIEHDAGARLEAVPRSKQIGYYSDMYKLEFALPKFNMYKRILAKLLAEKFVVDRGWSEARAIELGLEVLCENSERIFGVGRHERPPHLPAPAGRESEADHTGGALDDLEVDQDEVSTIDLGYKAPPDEPDETGKEQDELSTIDLGDQDELSTIDLSDQDGVETVDLSDNSAAEPLDETGDETAERPDGVNLDFDPPQPGGIKVAAPMDSDNEPTADWDVTPDAADPAPKDAEASGAETLDFEIELDSDEGGDEKDTAKPKPDDRDEFKLDL